MDRRPLFVFSPLPPAKNGIVDYMYALLQELQTHYYDCSVFCADVFAEAPHHVRVRDEALAFRHLHGADRAATSRDLGAVFARHWRDGDLKNFRELCLVRHAS
jgi:hypothetical protein